MYKYASIFVVIALAFAIPTHAAAEGNRSVLFQVGGGLYAPTYPSALEQDLSTIAAQPGVDRVKLSLNAALGVALSERSFLMGRIDGMGDRLADAYDYLQLNLYLYSLGLRYYPATTGFYLEGGAGATKGVLQSSLYGQTASPNGFGFGAAAGYDFNAAPRGFGLTLEAKSVAYPGAVFTGEVVSVDSRVDPSTRSVIVRALVPNDDGLLKPGMFLNVHLSRGTADVLVVPEESLVPEQGDVFVYVVQDGKASKRKIQTGQRTVGTVQVTDGLQAGEIVVTEGTQKLRDGASVSVTEPTAAPRRSVAAGEGDGPAR